MSNPNYVLNHKNIMRIDYLEDFVGIKIPKSILFNITQISEEEVIDLINLDKQRKEKIANEQEAKRKEHDAFTAKQQQAKIEAESLVEDVPEAKEEVITNTIKVTATVRQLQGLNEFCIKNGIAVEGVPEASADELPF